jgi:hypothetical protein
MEKDKRDDPPAWFSSAAIERIARSVSVDPPSGGSSASALLAQYDYPAGSWLGPHYFPVYVEYESSKEFYAFAQLLELGAMVGYLKIEDWDESKLFHDRLKEFAETERAKDNTHQADLTLINGLLERLEKGKSCGEKRDKSTFYAFASLLHLEGRIRKDWDARNFLEEVRENWQPRDDLGFLLSPETFAEALVQGMVEGVEMRAARGGLAALRYLEWLSDILTRVQEVEGLAEAFARQARWCHDTEKVVARISIWANRMIEWSQSGIDPAGEAAWRNFKGRLSPILNLVVGVVPRLEPGGSMEELSARELQERGRIGAARRVARQKALLYREELRNAKEQDARNLGQDLLLACLDLADIGDITAAAVIVAPFEELLGSEAEFQQLMKRALEGEAPISAQEAAESVGQQTPLEAPKQDQYFSQEKYFSAEQ